MLAVAEVCGGRAFVNETLRERRARGELDEREAALAREIGLGAVRHWFTIRCVLTRLAELTWRRLPPELAAVLTTAAYQLIWMDRVPVFAAVDESVELARELCGGRAPGMANAVLRKVARAIAERRAAWEPLDAKRVRVGRASACLFSIPVLPDPSARHEHLAAATAERRERYGRLAARLGEEAAEQVSWASQASPVQVVQRNRLRLAQDAFAARVQSELAPDAEVCGDAAYLPPGAGAPGSALFGAGLAYAQDTTARQAAEFVAARAGERVMDLCAAPGGKSIAMALDMRDAGEIVACDSSRERLERVGDNVRRLGLACVRLQPVSSVDEASSEGLPAGAAPVSGLGMFDAALVDAPCSNSGVIARRPEARLGLSREKIESLVRLQRALLRRAAAQVRPGGRLVYSTCSIESEENEQVIGEFLAGQTAWRLDQQRATLPVWGARLSDWRDGGYVARLVRSA